jgi:hypothetical protein
VFNQSITALKLAINRVGMKLNNEVGATLFFGLKISAEQFVARA